MSAPHSHKYQMKRILGMLPFVIVMLLSGSLHAEQWNQRLGARFLQLFTVYQWNKGLCSASTGEYGMCMLEDECIMKRGILGGPCAEGHGTCCIFMASCGETIRENGTYFVNPQYPNQYDSTGSCQLTILKSNSNVCQIRLDLEHFALVGPERVNHVCNTDQLIVSGGSPVPITCGVSHGEHMYVDVGVGRESNPILMTIITSDAPFPRSWRIRTTQIECGSISKADTGCLQYYSGVYGRVKSFNFDPIAGLHLSNQDYSVCIRTERNFCGIQYTVCPDLNSTRSNSFTLSGDSNGGRVASMVGSGAQGTPNACRNDWLLIGCARVADKYPQSDVCEDRLCGGSFNAEVSMMEDKAIISNVRPFRLSFHTDAVEAPDDSGNRGFCLDYVQQPCTNG